MKALSLRVVVSLAGLACFVAGALAYLRGAVPVAENLPLAGAALIGAAALARRYGVALPGNGFSSYVVGVMLYAILDRGWAFAALVAPFAMIVGDILLRRLPLKAALTNAAHLTTGATLVGLLYAQLGGQTGTTALTAGNLTAGRTAAEEVHDHEHDFSEDMYAMMESHMGSGR